MLHLRRLDLLDTTVLTVSGRNVERCLDDWAESERRPSFSAKFYKSRTTSIRTTSFFLPKPRGKRNSPPPSFSNRQHCSGRFRHQKRGAGPHLIDTDNTYRKTGPVRFFTSEQKAVAAIKQKLISPETIMVVAGIGPLGTGMEETYQITSALKHLPYGKDIALLTDARFFRGLNRPVHRPHWPGSFWPAARLENYTTAI